ncbi:MAG TPA: serine hydrolase domain-containing protein [Kofleriaceae bacterium]|nr:serine hydrolase domain-containing protein [Kofleriaceae bacterium]
MQRALITALLIVGCAHQRPPSEQEIEDLYTRANWPGLQRACERAFAADHKPESAQCVAMAYAKQNLSAQAIAWLERAVRAGLEWPLAADDPDFASLAGNPRFVAVVDNSHAQIRARNVAKGVGSGIVASSPSAEGIDASALAALLAAAKQSNTSALVILHGGKLAGEWYFGGESVRTETMSATKAVASLAVGVLLQDGKIDSLDAPMTTWFPEWKDGVHDAITLRHILSHTSNLDAPRDASAIYTAGDATHYALTLPLAGAAGSAFFYNNAAVNLIPALVHRITGKSIEPYLRERLFGPLGIRDIEWQTDDKGMPFGMSGLRIHAIDFAKLGQLVLQHGRWKNQQLVSSTYIDALMRPAQSFKPTSSLLWWLAYPEDGVVLDDAFFRAAHDKGLPAEHIAKLEPLRGKEIASDALFATLAQTLGDGWADIWTGEVLTRKLQPATFARGTPYDVSARGSFDQLLLVFPDRDLVVVRFTTTFDESHFDASSFPQLDRLARELVKR